LLLQKGVDIIYQDFLTQGEWRADGHSSKSIYARSVGDWSYEIIYARLARETRGRMILQLCLCLGMLFPLRDLCRNICM